MAIKFNELDTITFNGAVYNEVTKSSDNTSAVTQEASNVTYDNFLLHSSKEWLSTIENVSSELIKEAKETSDKVKADSKVIDATKKAAPDGQPYKDTEKKIQEGIKDLAANVKAMTKITEYSGAINFITSTAVNTITGSIVNISDLGTINKSPSITNTTNVEVNNAATSINYSDTVFTKSDRRVTVSNQELLSASDQHSVVNNTTSITSTNNKTAAVEAHEVITNEQKQYNTTLTSLSVEATLIGSKGQTSVIASNNITIGAGQSSKASNSQAEIDTELTDSILNGKGTITILSTGDITSQATGNAITSADTVGTNANKIGLLSIDFSSQSTTTSINSDAQSSLTSDGITYTGNKNTGILISPTAILAGTGLAPLIPIIGEVLPPIIVDIPELPEFPFGNLADFLSKCLPFTSAINIPNQQEQDEEVDIALEEPLIPQNKEDSDEEVLIDLEEPLIIQDKGGPQEEPVDISLEEPLVVQDKTKNTKESAAPKGTKTEQKDRDAATIPKVKTDNKQEEKPFTSKAVVSSAAKLGILNKCYINTPEGNTNPKTTTNLLNDLPAITPKLSFSESLKSISGLQQSEVVNSFNKDLRTNINNNYQDFLKAAAIVDTLGPQTTPLPEFSKTVNDFITDNKTTVQIRQFLNTLRPIGQGGQQPPNVQEDIRNAINTTITNSQLQEALRTPPNQGQGILDLLQSPELGKQSNNIFSSTTDNWFNPEDITDFSTSDIEFGEQLLDNQALSSFSELLNNQYVDIIKGFIPDNKIQSALSLTQDIASGKITTPEQYASRLASLIGGDIAGYIGYAQQAFDIYKQVEAGNYSSLLGIPGISNVLGSQGTAIASKVLGLIGKKNITDKDIYDIAGSIFTALTGIGIPLLDELAKLLGCIGSIKEQQPFLQDISDPDLQDIIDFLPRIIQTVPVQNRNRVLNITPTNCNQISELSAEEANINVTEIGQGYIKFKLANKDLIRFNNNPIPTIGTPVNLYSEFYTDRLNNNVLIPYKIGTQFTSNVLEYTITNKVNDEYKALQNNPNIKLTLEDNIIGALFEYTSNDIGNRLQPFILDSYVLL